MHVEDEHRVEFAAVVLRERGSDLLDKVVDLLVLFLGVFLHGRLEAGLDLAEDVLDLPRPPHLVAGQAHHALIQHHPLHPNSDNGTQINYYMLDKLFIISLSKIMH